MAGRGHGHGCDGDDKHDETPEMGLQYSLYKKIDSENLECLNEKTQHSGRSVFKSWEDRLNPEKFVESDVDEELLFNIPFTGNVKLKGIIIIGGEGDTHPSKMRLFKNRPKMSFDDVAIASDQDFELHPDNTGTLEYATKIVKFSSVHHLSIHIPKNFGSETTKVYYIGLRGEYSEGHRHGVTICTYEARPNIADHKTSLADSVTREIQFRDSEGVRCPSDLSSCSSSQNLSPAASVFTALPTRTFSVPANEIISNGSRADGIYRGSITRLSGGKIIVYDAEKGCAGDITGAITEITIEPLEEVGVVSTRTGRGLHTSPRRGGK